MMTPKQIGLNQSPQLTSLLLGLVQPGCVAEKLFPRLPHALSELSLAQLGNERFRRYNLRRAPGTPTHRVEISYEGKVYAVDQYSVDVPIARELIRESDESRRLNVDNHLDISRIAVVTANDILSLDYELEAASLATTDAVYEAGHVLDLVGPLKWSHWQAPAVSQIRNASDLIRKKIGRRPNTLLLSPVAAMALMNNFEVVTCLPEDAPRPANLEQLKVILSLENIVIGEAIWKDASGTGLDVWGNNAVLAYVPKITSNGSNSMSFTEPAFGFTSVLEGHPFAETPHYEESAKSWIYGATFERRPGIADKSAAFLFKNPN